MSAARKAVIVFIVVLLYKNAERLWRLPPAKPFPLK
jgi:hypothetical protein